MTADISTEAIERRAKEYDRAAERAMQGLHCGSENWEYKRARALADAHARDAAMLRALVAERDALRHTVAGLQRREAQLLDDVDKLRADPAAVLLEQMDSFKSITRRYVDPDTALQATEDTVRAIKAWLRRLASTRSVSQ